MSKQHQGQCPTTAMPIESVAIHVRMQSDREYSIKITEFSIKKCSPNSAVLVLFYTQSDTVSNAPS